MFRPDSTPLGQPALVLNKSWAVVNVTTVKRAFGLLYCGRARVIAPDTFKIHDFESWTQVPVNGDPVVRTVSFPIRTPQVIVLKSYDSMPVKDLPFSRRNIYRRDNYTCQYCGRRCRTEDLTIDHVVPRSRGGTTSWDNCVCACSRCNARKGSRLPEMAGMRLRSRPSRPNWHPDFSLAGKRDLPPAWKNFIRSNN